MVQWRDKEVSRGLGEQLEGWRGLGKGTKILAGIKGVIRRLDEEIR